MPYRGNHMVPPGHTTTLKQEHALLFVPAQPNFRRRPKAARDHRLQSAVNGTQAGKCLGTPTAPEPGRLSMAESDNNLKRNRNAIMNAGTARRKTFCPAGFPTGSQETCSPCRELSNQGIRAAGGSARAFLKQQGDKQALRKGRLEAQSARSISVTP